jgi:lipopolysaccharide export system protein LptC
LTAVSHIDDRGSHAFMGAGRTDSDRVFRAARRHSRLVRFLRVGIPVGVVVGALVTVGIMTWLNPLRALAKLPVSIGSLAVSGTKITMHQPRIAGYTRDSRPYTVTARAAAQDVTKPDVIELTEVDATMQTQDKGSFKITALTGLYDSKVERLTLRDNIVVTSANFEALMSEASCDVRAGHILSEQPVVVKMPQGTVNANRLEVFESGNIIRFDGGVVVDMNGAGAASADAAAGNRR